MLDLCFRPKHFEQWRDGRIYEWLGVRTAKKVARVVGRRLFRLGPKVDNTYFISDPSTDGLRAFERRTQWNEVMHGPAAALFGWSGTGLLGRGDLIGRPLASMLTHEKVALSVHGRSTKDLAEFTRNADIIITGVGQKNLLTGDMVKEGVVVIDVGINRVEDSSVPKGYRIVGDVDFDSVSPKASAITPVPGGVGVMTIAMLMKNTLDSAMGKFIK